MIEGTAPTVTFPGDFDFELDKKSDGVQTRRGEPMKLQYSVNLTSHKTKQLQATTSKYQHRLAVS